MEELDFDINELIDWANETDGLDVDNNMLIWYECEECHKRYCSKPLRYDNKHALPDESCLECGGRVVRWGLHI